MKIEVVNLAAREQIHRLVDELPDDVLAAVERMLAGLHETIANQGAGWAPGKMPTGGRAVVAPTDAAEKRLRSFFRRFEGRSLADELIAERRQEARGEPS